MPRRNAATLVAIGLVFAAAPAHGHTLLMTRGEAVIHADHVAVELQVAAEDLLHWQAISPDADGRISLLSLGDAAERHAATLQRVFVIREAKGNRLTCEPFRAEPSWRSESSADLHELRKLHATYRSICAWSTAPRFLTFQLLMTGSDIGVLWQVVLAVHGADAGHAQALRLTSRGNAETVEIAWRGGQAEILAARIAGECTACADRGVARLKELCADIDIADEAIVVRLSIPLPLLQTWITLPNSDGEFLDQDSVKEAAYALAARAVAVEFNGKLVAAEVGDLRFVSLDRQSSSISLWTGRMSAQLRFRGVVDADRVGLHWNLFNSAVVTATAFIRSDGGCSEHEFSTYQPFHDWHRRLHR